MFAFCFYWSQWTAVFVNENGHLPIEMQEKGKCLWVRSNKIQSCEKGSRAKDLKGEENQARSKVGGTLWV